MARITHFPDDEPSPDLRYWKLSSSLSIFEASLLLAGYDPEEASNCSDAELIKFKGYGALKSAICNAIETDRLDTERLVRHEDNFSTGDIDIRRTLIAVSDLEFYVTRKNLSSPFFGDDSVRKTADKQSPFFAHKLDAANRAWAAVSSDPSMLKGRSPRQALEKWLTDHADELGLLNRAGKPNVTGIEETAKVANWRPEGGATPTASGPANDLVTLPTHGGVREVRRASFAADLDDEIPF